MQLEIPAAIENIDALAARLQEKVIQVAARNFAERICMCRAAVTGHEVSSNCSRYKKRSKTTGTNLLYTTNIQKGGVLL